MDKLKFGAAIFDLKELASIQIALLFIIEEKDRFSDIMGFQISAATIEKIIKNCEKALEKLNNTKENLKDISISEN